MMKTVFVLLAIVAMVHADVYMHNPRGSNNRLSANNQARTNANRLFDSQNNNRGGYNVGDSDATQTNGRGNGQGVLSYYKTSVLRIEWTNQHGAGNPKLDNNFVLQYTCSDMEITGLWSLTGIRDGVPDAGNANAARVQNDGQTQRGRHEPISYFADCATRQRNTGLYLGGENLDNGNNIADADTTRQDSNNNDFGTECTEERDYYPYWHPTPWKDIAILTSNTTRCPMYLAESQNVQVKGYCAGAPEHNNREECNDDAAGTWTEAPAWGIEPPVCEEVAFSRANHLGNTIGGEPLSYNWSIPEEVTSGSDCVLRLRYNISTSDIPWETYYEEDEDGNEIVLLKNNPGPNILKGTGFAAGVEINVDRTQFGRTFQDRSHTFKIIDRPSNIPPADQATIYNLNVRGRRGNIVEVYPAVEYDFIPRELTVRPQDYVHIAWTGSLSSPNGAGQGTAESDKSNIVCIAAPGHTVPLTHSDPGCTLFGSFADHERFATAGIGGATIDDLLNNAPAMYDGGLVQPGAVNLGDGGVVGDHHFLCTRNNHFSNRAQRGTITVAV